MTAPSYMTTRRARLRSEGRITRLATEISTPARLSLDHLATIHRRTVRAELEHLIMEAVSHVGKH